MRNEKLVAAREDRGWSQAVAAEKIGVSRVAYARWEEQGLIPRLWAINRAREAFNMSAEQLGFRKYPSSTANTGVLSASPSLAILSGEQLAAVSSLLGGSMKHFDPSKRATLEQLGKIVGATAGTALFSPLQSLLQVGNLLHHEEMLAISATNIPILWRLYFDGHLSEVEHVLPDYFLPLSALAEQPSLYQKQAASLASKVHQLACMITLQPQDYSSALIHADQAIQYARVAEDPDLQVASLIRKALVYFYLKRPSQRLWAYQEAMQYGRSISPLLQGRLYMGLAETHSDLSRFDATHQKEALQFLDRMHEAFPDKPKEDPNFAFTHFKLPQGYEGLVYLNLNQPGKAWNILEQMDKNTPTTVVPDRVELTVRQAKVAVALGNLELGKTYLESAVTSSKALGSKLRYQESFDLYQHMQETWPAEQRVRELAELFQTH